MERIGYLIEKNGNRVKIDDIGYKFETIHCVFVWLVQGFAGGVKVLQHHREFFGGKT